MKIFKIADCIIQLLLFSGAIGWFLVAGTEVISLGYAAMGCWQLFSAFVHLIFPRYNDKKLRLVYLLALLFIAILLTPFHFFPRLERVSVPIIIYLSPIMAIYYCIVCYRETLGIEKNTIE